MRNLLKKGKVETKIHNTPNQNKVSQNRQQSLHKMCSFIRSTFADPKNKNVPPNTHIMSTLVRFGSFNALISYLLAPNSRYRPVPIGCE